MDPLVSLYYFAPCCAGMIAAMGIRGEWRSIRWEAVQGVGWWMLAANGLVAMGLNVASVFLVSLTLSSFSDFHLRPSVCNPCTLYLRCKQIGKTSSLVLTLCGVAKSISLIGASTVIWGTVVTPIQFVGNGIAMAGLVYYNVGGEKLQDITENTRSRLARFWQQRSRTTRVVLAVGLVVAYLGILGGVAVGCGLRVELRDWWTMGAIH